MTMMISVMTGNEVQKDGMAKVAAFQVPLDSGKERFLGSTSGQGGDVMKAGSYVREPAVTGVREAIGGKWVIQNYQVAEGVLIKLSATRRQGVMKLMESAQLYLRVRQNAAYRKVNIPLLNMSRSRFEEAQVSGRFDILTVEDLKVEYGITVPPQFHNLHSVASRERVFRIEVIQPEVRPKQQVTMRTVTTDTGDKVTVRERKRTRSLKF